MSLGSKKDKDHDDDKDKDKGRLQAFFLPLAHSQPVDKKDKNKNPAEEKDSPSKPTKRLSMSLNSKR